MKMINLQNKMATKKVKYAMALRISQNEYQKSTFYMESFTLFSNSAHLLDYIYRPTIAPIPRPEGYLRIRRCIHTHIFDFLQILVSYR